MFSLYSYYNKKLEKISIIIFIKHIVYPNNKIGINIFI